MTRELDRYFSHIYRNTDISLMPTSIPEFNSKEEIDAWFSELKRKVVLFEEYNKTLKKLEKKQQGAINTLVNDTKNALDANPRLIPKSK